MWFKGPIPEAISITKKDGTVLLVFVTDESEENPMEKCFNDDKVVSFCTENRLTSLRLISPSEPADQFAKIYPLPSVPCTFLIGTSGLPLDIINSEIEINVEMLVERISRSVKLNSGVLETEKQLSKSPSSQPESSTTSTTSPANARPLEERIEKARQLLKEKEREEQISTQEKEKSEELDRREMGKKMQELEEKRREKEMVQAAKERKQQRKDDKVALERIRQQIAIDREEKRKKFQDVQDAEQKARDERKEQLLEAKEQKLREEQEEIMKIARIQFRFPDSSRITQNFDSTALFSELVEFVSQSRPDIGAFQLIQMHPRREFTDQQHFDTLIQLGLVPSAVILIVPENAWNRGGEGSGKQTGITGYLSSFLGWIIASLLYLWHGLVSFLGLAGGGGANMQTQGQTQGQDQNIPESSKRGFGRMTDHTQENKKDDDDEQKFWNGNSTQQL